MIRKKFSKEDSTMAWQPTPLSYKLHSIPHFNLALDVASDYFDFNSRNYTSTLIFIGLLPTFLALFFLSILLAYYIWLNNCKLPNQDRRNRCTCFNWTWASAILACFMVLLMLLGLLFEVIAHIQLRGIMSTLKNNLDVTTEILDIYDYAKQYKIVDTDLTLDAPFKATELASLGEGWLDKRNMVIMRERFAYYADEVLKVFSTVQNPYIDPVHLESSFHDRLDTNEFRRCLLFCVGWIICFIIFLQKPLKSSSVTLIAISWCCLMAFGLMICTVGLADLCQHDPTYVIDTNIDQSQINDQIKRAVPKLCKTLQAKSDTNKQKIRRIYYEWFLYFFNTEKDLKALHATDDENATVKITNDEIFAGVVHKWLANLIGTDNNAKLSMFINGMSRLDCDKTKLKYGQAIAGHDFRQLCLDDYILKWFFRELICALILGLVYIIILMVLLTRSKPSGARESLKSKWRRRKKLWKSKTKNLSKKRSSKSSCNRGNNKICQEKSKARPDICPIKYKCSYYVKCSNTRPKYNNAGITVILEKNK